jgi:hypothetical protein
VKRAGAGANRAAAPKPRTARAAEEAYIAPSAHQWIMRKGHGGGRHQFSSEDDCSAHDYLTNTER